MSLPTRREVAVEAAKYAASEFKSLESWIGYPDELADTWLTRSTDEGNGPFSMACAIDYVIPRVASMIKWNTGMQHYTHYVKDPKIAIARVAGHVVGEWAAGKRSLDSALGDW